MIKTLVLIRDITMYICAFGGLFLVGYVRVLFSSRQQKSPGIPLDYSEQEKKLRKTGIILLVAAVVLALIPTKNLV